MHWKYLSLLMSATLVVYPSPRAVAQEVKLFKLVDYSGHMETENLFRMIDNRSTGVTTSNQDFSRKTELGLDMQGYIYHPYLFDFQIGGGLVFDQNDAERSQTFLSAANTIETSSGTKGLLWNMNLFAQLLKQKPYPVTLFYTRDTPLIQTGIEGSFTQINENYGLNTQLTNVLPVNLTLNAIRNTASGESLDRVIDNTHDRITFRADKRLSSGNRAIFNYELTQLGSRNGDPRREIREVQRMSHRTSFNSNWRFGEHDQFYFTENAGFNWSNNPDVRNISLAPGFRWQHTQNLVSNYRYSFLQTERPESDFRTRLQSADASVRYTPTSRLHGYLAIEGEQSNEVKSFSQRSYGGNGKINYSRPVFSGGSLDLAGGLDYKHNNREASLAQISVLEESHQLNGTAPVALGRDFVITGSIVVRNDTDTQTYIEGVDYRLLEVGSQTQIERLIGGSILDGETVLVDYRIETGGTFSYSSFNKSFSADLELFRHYRLFLNYRGSKQSVESGISTTPLNSIESVEIGARFDLPLRWQGINVGGSARYGFQDEDINPFNRTSIEGYAQVPLPYRMQLRINARYNIVDNLNSSEDQNLFGINGNLDWRARRNLTIAAEGYYDKDNGGSVLRSRTEATLRANWNYRRLTLSAEAKYREEVQGDLKNNNLSLWLTVRRSLL